MHFHRLGSASFEIFGKLKILFKTPVRQESESDVELIHAKKNYKSLTLRLLYAYLIGRIWVTDSMGPLPQWKRTNRKRRNDKIFHLDLMAATPT
jgi:hypothetical protein